MNILALARGPKQRIIYDPGYNINGFQFHTRDRDENKKLKIMVLWLKGKEIMESCHIME